MAELRKLLPKVWHIANMYAKTIAKNTQDFAKTLSKERTILPTNKFTKKFANSAHYLSEIQEIADMFPKR